MEKYTLSKTIGIVLGTLVVLAALGYGLLYLLGTSLGNALGSNIATSAKDRYTLEIILSVCL